MRWPGWGTGLLAGIAGLGGVFLIADPPLPLGLDPGPVGVALLSLAAWGALFGISTAPRTSLDDAVAPGEWRAWIGLGFTSLLIAYVLAKAPVFRAAEGPRELWAVGRNVVVLLGAWTVLGWVLEARWKGRVLEDERDREIEARGERWGRGALVFCVLGVAVMLALTPPARLGWATPIAIAHLLVFCLLGGSAAEHAVAALSYWRDRRP